MSAQQKSSNGTAQKSQTETGKTTATAEIKTPAPAPEQKPEEKGEGETAKVVTLPPSTTPPAAELDLPPVEDRILKVNQLFGLVEKHETLLETKKKLKAFRLSTDGSRDQLKVVDSKGNDFSTYNSSVIADVMETLNRSIDAKIAEVEAQIRF